METIENTASVPQAAQTPPAQPLPVATTKPRLSLVEKLIIGYFCIYLIHVVMGWPFAFLWWPLHAY